MTTSDISTAIPTYIENSAQLDLLEVSLMSLSKQTKLPFEIVVSDNTRHDDYSNKVKELTKKFKELNISYILNDKNFGIGANSNFAVRNTSGQIVHVLHQDDFLLNSSLYENVQKHIASHPMDWIVAEGKVGDRLLESNFNSTTKFGFNELGGPSSVFVAKNNFKPYNDRYNMLVDVINYHEYYLQLGNPFIFKGANIEYSIHDFQYSKNYSSKKVKSELIDFIYEYNISSTDVKRTLNLVKREIHHQRLLIYAARITNRISGVNFYRYILINYGKALKRRIFNYFI
jgi:glycosyltransferase involved in cell wall biosynthesis